MRPRFLSVLAAVAAAIGMVAVPASASAHHTRAGHHHARLHVEALRARQELHTRAARPAAVSLPALVSASPVDWTPNVSAGSAPCNTQWFGANCAPSTVYSMAAVNGEVVVVGAFTQVCVPGTSAGHCQPGTTVTRNDIFAYQLGTGSIDPNFAPALDQGPVSSVVAGPGNTVYVGGNFTTVNGTSHSEVVQLTVAPGTPSDGQVVSAFNGQLSGFANAGVSTLAYSGDALYVGGVFRQADGSSSTGLARLNATTGALDTSFTFTLSNPPSGLALGIGPLALSPDGNHLAIGGTFLDVNGQARPRLALINTGGGYGATASLANWSAPLLANSCSKQHNYVNGIDFSADGSFFVVVTTGYKSAGGASICDAAARFETGASGTKVQPVWIDYTGGDTLHSVAVAGSIVYIGGHNRWINNECGDNHVCEANAVLVNGVAALDANTGLALPWWQPGTLRGVGVQALIPVQPGAAPGFAGGLLLGTDVSTIGGAFHDQNALFPLTATTAQTPGGPVQSGMFSLGRLGGLDESNTGRAAMCLDDAGDSGANGNKVQLWTCLNDAAQNWVIQPDSTIRINGACLSLASNSPSPPNGTKVSLGTCSGAAGQRWQQGGNTLVNGADGKCLDDPNASTSNGVQLQIWTCNGLIQQSWPLPVAQAPPAPPASGPVSLSLTQSDSQVPCLDNPGGSGTSGTQAELWTCVENPEQSWTTGPDGTIQTGGLCLATQADGTSNGTLVVLDTCNGSASQVWQPGANYGLVNKAAGKCLDDTGKNTTNGTRIQIWACTGADNQAWRLPAD